MIPARPLVLIEPYAHRACGHHQRTLVALATMMPGSVIIPPNGLAADPTPLRDAQARMVTGPAGPCTALS